MVDEKEKGDRPASGKAWYGADKQRAVSTANKTH